MYIISFLGIEKSGLKNSYNNKNLIPFSTRKNSFHFRKTNLRKN